MNFIEMKVTGLTIDPFTSMPIIILRDMEDKQALPIWIGLIEASAIATELEHIQLSRPMTHDLLKSLLEAFGLQAVKIMITELRDNTFYAAVHFKGGDGKIVELDARPSDAIAIALRAKAPIFVERSVIEKSRQIDLGVDDSEQRKRKWTEILEGLSPEDFGKYKM